MSVAKIDSVNPVLGTKGAGSCLIGPYMPMGMVRIGPDSLFPNPNNGYQPGDSIGGFSHMHVSGTGGAPRYGHILTMPFIGEPRINSMPPFVSVPFKNRANTIPKDVSAKVGYFSCQLPALGTKIELTCTRHAGHHRYEFSGTGQRNILIDSGAALQGTIAPADRISLVEEWDSTTQCIGGSMHLSGPTEVYGRSDFRGGWGHDKPYSVFYYVKSRVPFESARLATDGGLLPTGMDSSAAGSGCRVVLSFGSHSTTVELDVGISYISIAQARSHVQTEIGSASLEEIRTACEREWNTCLSRFSIDGGTKDQQTIFYTLLYRLLSMPTDLGTDSENPFWKSGVRQFTDWYCLWDSIRNANSLVPLFAPELAADQMNALIDIAEHTGWLPDAHIAGHHAYQQSACAAEILFSEAAAKGVLGVEYAKALPWCVKNTTTESPDVLVKGRFLEYTNRGYLSTDVPKASVSRFIEYTYHDWCIARLADACGDHATATRLRSSSRGVWNMWRDDKKSFWPRRPDGSWEESANAESPIGDVWNDPFTYEGPLVCWSFNVLHDIRGLIGRFGGNNAFVKHLDWYFASGLHHVKETRMHIPHLYSYAGRPDKAADAVRTTLTDSFHNTPDGLKDNEDMGCESGYFIFNSMGFYPIYGQTHYMLVPPLFDKMEIEYGKTGNKLTITADRGTSTGRYIHSVAINGEKSNRAWIEHAEIASGGTIEFILEDSVNDFGTVELPPNGL